MLPSRTDGMSVAAVMSTSIGSDASTGHGRGAAIVLPALIIVEPFSGFSSFSRMIGLEDNDLCMSVTVASMSSPRTQNLAVPMNFASGRDSKKPALPKTVSGNSERSPRVPL